MRESYLNGLSTAEHDVIDVSAYYKRVYETCCRLRGGYFVDAFSGGGRDIAEIYKQLEGDGRFLAIDGDPLRIRDMAAKPHFVVVQDESSLHRAFEAKQIAVLQAQLPSLPVNLRKRVSFILCNAGLMFVAPSDVRAVLRELTSWLCPGGQMVLRFSLERPDKTQELGTSYFMHDTGFLKSILKEEGLILRQGQDIPDPNGRKFSWLDWQITAP